MRLAESMSGILPDRYDDQYRPTPLLHEFSVNVSSMGERVEQRMHCGDDRQKESTFRVLFVGWRIQSEKPESTFRVL